MRAVVLLITVAGLASAQDRPNGIVAVDGGPCADYPAGHTLEIPTRRVPSPSSWVSEARSELRVDGATLELVTDARPIYPSDLPEPLLVVQGRKVIGSYCPPPRYYAAVEDTWTSRDASEAYALLRLKFRNVNVPDDHWVVLGMGRDRVWKASDEVAAVGEGYLRTEGNGAIGVVCNADAPVAFEVSREESAPRPTRPAPRLCLSSKPPGYARAVLVPLLGIDWGSRNVTRAGLSLELQLGLEWTQSLVSGVEFHGATARGAGLDGFMFTGLLGTRSRYHDFLGWKLELRGGYARGEEGPFGVAGLGVAASLFWFDVGYSFNVPVLHATPEWFVPHAFSMTFAPRIRLRSERLRGPVY